MHGWLHTEAAADHAGSGREAEQMLWLWCLVVYDLTTRDGSQSALLGPRPHRWPIQTMRGARLKCFEAPIEVKWNPRKALAAGEVLRLCISFHFAYPITNAVFDFAHFFQNFMYVVQRNMTLLLCFKTSGVYRRHLSWRRQECPSYGPLNPPLGHASSVKCIDEAC